MASLRRKRCLHPEGWLIVDPVDCRRALCGACGELVADKELVEEALNSIRTMQTWDETWFRKQ